MFLPKTMFSPKPYFHQKPCFDQKPDQTRPEQTRPERTRNFSELSLDIQNLALVSLDLFRTKNTSFPRNIFLKLSGTTRIGDK